MSCMYEYTSIPQQKSPRVFLISPDRGIFAAALYHQHTLLIKMSKNGLHLMILVHVRGLDKNKTPAMYFITSSMFTSLITTI